MRREKWQQELQLKAGCEARTRSWLVAGDTYVARGERRGVGGVMTSDESRHRTAETERREAGGFKCGPGLILIYSYFLLLIS